MSVKFFAYSIVGFLNKVVAQWHLNHQLDEVYTRQSMCMIYREIYSIETRMSLYITKLSSSGQKGAQKVYEEIVTSGIAGNIGRCSFQYPYTSGADRSLPVADPPSSRCNPQSSSGESRATKPLLDVFNAILLEIMPGNRRPCICTRATWLWASNSYTFARMCGTMWVCVWP